MENSKSSNAYVTITRELAFQHEEREKRASELQIANQELIFQNQEKEKRAAELILANKELAFQNIEKEKRAEELSIANNELRKAKYHIDELNTGLQQKITERTAQLEELKESEKRYSNLFNLSPQPKWVYDARSFRCVQVNEAAVAVYGYSKKEFLDMNLQALAHRQRKGGNNTPVPKDNTGTMLRTGRKKHFKKSGEQMDVDIYTNPIIIDRKPFVSMIAIDVTEKLQFEHTITRAIIKTQEDERYEIGSELHDNVCQILASSLMSFRLLKGMLDPAGSDLFNKSEEYILMATNEIRNLSHRLAPAFFDDANLEEAFIRVMHDFNHDKKFHLDLNFDKGLAKANISMDLQLNLYRILQAQLSNINKYAAATEIRVRLVVQKLKLKMSIRDNGVGFDSNSIKGGIGFQI